MPTMQQVSDIRESILPTPTEETPKETTAESISESSAPIEEISEEIQEETVEGSSEETPSSDGDEVQYINELPEALGLDTEQFYNLKLKTASGKEYTWSEIKDQLQANETGNAEVLTAKQKLEAQEAQLAQVLQANQPIAPSQELAEAQTNYTALQQRQTQLVNSLDALRESEDFLGMTKVQSEVTQIQAALGQLGGYIQQEQGKLNQTYQEQQQTYLATQHKQLATQIPAWAENPKKVSGEITQYLLANNVSMPEIQSLNDARVIGLVYKAMQFDNAQQGLQETVNNARGKTVKRIVKGSAGGGRSRTADVAPIIEKARNSKRIVDKKAAFRAVAQNAGLLGKE